MSDQLSLFSFEEKPLPKSVSDITAYIRQLFDNDLRMQDVWVEGEISNFKRAPSGHLYFSLKDATSELTCVMWKSSAIKLRYAPQHGDRVTAYGRISVYEPRGTYQLYAELLHPAGVGDLNRQFELLKAKLEAEGLFEPDRKRPLPTYPRRIGIVTSPSAAALQDVLNIFSRRCPAVELILSPTQVQGNTAPPLIVAALDALNRREDVDVIMLIRGGGSLEDLWCFNDERVVRAVAASRIPTITGVGHEIDFTLVDFASDYRAPTPSAAAEIISPDTEAILYGLQDIQQRMKAAVSNQIYDYRQRIEREQRTLRLLSPANRINTLRQKLDDQVGKMARTLSSRLRLTRQEVTSLDKRLHSASPQSLLQRGYAIVTRAGDGKRISSVQDAAPGVSIIVQMQDGELKATVKERNKQDE